MITAMDINSGNPADDDNQPLLGDETENKILYRIDARRKAEGAGYSGQSYEQIAERVLLDPRRPFVESVNAARLVGAAVGFYEVATGRRLISSNDLAAWFVDARECLSHLIAQATRAHDAEQRRAARFTANAYDLAARPPEPKRGRGRPRKDRGK